MNEPVETVVASNAKVNDLPSVEYLKECFHCNPETGVLVWRSRPQNHFPSHQAMLAWNGRMAGQRAGYYHSKSKRLLVGLDKYGRIVMGHRIIWTMMVGPIPNGMQIDHINGDPSDNRLVNLRLATNQQNSLNSRRKSGPGVWRGLPRGVSPNGKKFRAKIRIDYKEICLGTFATPEEASVAYESAYIARAGSFARSSEQ